MGGRRREWTPVRVRGRRRHRAKELEEGEEETRGERIAKIGLRGEIQEDRNRRRETKTISAFVFGQTTTRSGVRRRRRIGFGGERRRRSVDTEETTRFRQPRPIADKVKPTKKPVLGT